MGDKIIFTDKKCLYCGKIKKEVWFSPTSNFDAFTCEGCNKVTYIDENYHEKKAEEVTDVDIYLNFMKATNVEWNIEQKESIMEECKDRAKKLNKINK
jgi:3-keto-L-gulonate-6-phosphate decarboxylase